MNFQIAVSTDKALLDIKAVHNFLCNESYWAKNRTIEEVEESINSSLCFGVFLNNSQIGFARVITDSVTFGYICDLFILKEHRGQGYSKVLMSHILSHTGIKKLKRILLITQDAHFLYNKFNFKQLANPTRYMELNN